MDARMESLGTENHKNPPHTELKKKRSNHKTVKNGLLCSFGGEGPRSPFFHTSISEILKISVQDPKMTARASKLIPRLSKSLPIWGSKRLAGLPRGLKEMARCRVMRAAHWIFYKKVVYFSKENVVFVSENNIHESESHRM